MVRSVKLVKSSSASPKVANCSRNSSWIFWLTVEDISPKRRLSSRRIKATASYCLPFFWMSWTDSPIISSLNQLLMISLLNTNPARIAVAAAKLLFSVLPSILSIFVATFAKIFSEFIHIDYCFKGHVSINYHPCKISIYRLYFRITFGCQKMFPDF